MIDVPVVMVNGAFQSDCVVYETRERPGEAVAHEKAPARVRAGANMVSKLLAENLDERDVERLDDGRVEDGGAEDERNLDHGAGDRRAHHHGTDDGEEGTGNERRQEGGDKRREGETVALAIEAAEAAHHDGGDSLGEEVQAGNGRRDLDDAGGDDGIDDGLDEVGAGENDRERVGGDDELRLDANGGQGVAHGHVEDEAGGEQDRQQDEGLDVDEAVGLDGGGDGAGFGAGHGGIPSEEVCVRWCRRAESRLRRRGDAFRVVPGGGRKRRPEPGG